MASEFGKTPFYLAIAAAIGTVRPPLGLLVLSVVLVTEALNAVLKRAVRRPRPPGAVSRGRRRPFEIAPDYSFPSCHAQNATAVYGTLALVAGNPSLTVVLAGCTVLVAWSRLRLRVHFASDIIVGAALGALTAILARLAAAAVLDPPISLPA